MGKHRRILQIVGYQNSGKTTLIEKLIRRLSESGLETGVIKHHGHGGEPEIGTPSKDSTRTFKAGAAVSGVEGDGVLQLAARVSEWNLEKWLEFYAFFSVDVLLVEGYKKEDYPKVVLVRSAEDWEELRNLSNIQCVISMEAQIVDGGIPVYTREQEAEYMEYLMESLL
ncbi:molybdopterin-guanine dinucleotide biosynthesis protein B [Falsibacillus pallidus]|uniref:Molybdopterin-guanine dinucleotide biosynthesis protein B n=1 Tax=Falsibacillus pallidus TaxID=493781 RepID=A0A370GC66_9BACI|nr:molybdopterin-guanine dinucleotide biosynthesis protein B [Falsibacillus pallidus]RDI41378.1 molybdopterin-guanine dinucleotide biosynthesis protein B [Falsibacillus pallidus]